MNPEIFKAYDIRGLHGTEMDETTALAVGRAFARVLGRLRGKEPGELRVGLGRDMRLTAPAMAAALREGLVDEGVTVLDAGMVATEMLYHLVGSRELDGGAMVTASHNPKAYTGVKLVREGALALSGDAGIGDVRREIEAGPGAAPGGGNVEEVDIWDEYREHVLSFVDPATVRPMKVVVDGGNGMGGPMVGPILERLGLDLEEMYFEPDGEFPDHEPNPLLEENRRMIIDRVRSSGADLGHRLGRRRGPLLLHRRRRGLLRRRLRLRPARPGGAGQEPGRDDPLRPALEPRRARPGRRAEGGRSGLSRVGHAFFKQRMREEGAVFGGEVSGHYYFRDFWNADSGTIPALLMLELLSGDGRSLAELMAEFRSRYFISGEINSEVDDPEAKMAEIEELYGEGAEVAHLDGVSIDHPDWHFNVRPSNTEPLLRLNLESLVSREHMEAKRDEVLAIIRA